ncbi:MULTISPECIES: CPBP family intramembrane glutamic endopeptidase [Paenibacillus]|uniref:CPBP family intramembrane glutamic endopeptidase n=1 Tax=Paenibacillus TaxID=44249 RepID=UPI00096EAB42|nr:type II CAAX endopeptidase family protein [Paenibacillus odorifer]MEC0131370.1 type II CAAX endopeptidase family protein [Paenibacillus odorifer]MEC0221991.1 type II CAAX endopeptidase family protein [Paenibacillus odorifer]OMD01178.1 CAAX protease family protein [Paenibacillus odorifer]OME46487.1 CAAX protease family protein [Paenibacillus odorifer]
MTSTEMWKKMDQWTWREFIALLALEFVFVIFVIKYAVQSMYEQWLGNTLYSGTLTGLTIAIVLLLGLYFIALRPKKMPWTEVGVKRFSAKDWWRIALWTLILIVFSVVTLYLTSFLGNTVDNSKTESLKQNVTLFTIIIGIVSAGIVSPFYEEIFYRGFVYRWLRTRVSMSWAIVISSLIFTLAHFPTMNAMPVNFISGVVLAWTYERTGSVVPGMIVHGVFNTIAVLLTAMS